MASERIKEVLVNCLHCGKRFQSKFVLPNIEAYALMRVNSEICIHCKRVTQCDFDNMTYVTEGGATGMFSQRL